MGDAAHAFPPDIGQGINAGLCDVVALDRALRGKDILTGQDGEKPESLGAALKEYERVQGPQVRDLHSEPHRCAMLYLSNLNHNVYVAPYPSYQITTNMRRYDP